MQEESVITCLSRVAGWNRFDHEDFRRRPEICINSKISTRTRGKRKAIPWSFVLRALYECISDIIDFLSFYHLYILGKKKNRKEADSIFIHQRCISLLYKYISFSMGVRVI